MAIKPILFNTDMVMAILDGRKTQTRRVIKPQPTNPRWNNIGWLGWDDGHGYRMKQPCEVGDILWVRETWSTHYDGIHPDLVYCYKADGIDLKSECLPGETNRWFPSIHMPKEAARIFLCVRAVRAERLREITERQARSEGAIPLALSADPEGTPDGERMWHEVGEALWDFSELWNETIPKNKLDEYGWVANPWVWVIEFERCEKPGGWRTPCP